MIIKRWPLIAMIAIITVFSIKASQKPTIIVLQGCSSSGKSSTAQELQNLYAQDDKPFMYIPMDNFLSFLPKKWLNLDPHDNQFNEIASDGVQFINIQEEKNSHPIIKVIIGRTAINAFDGMIHCIGALAQCNNNVIFEGAFPKALFEDIEQLKEKYTVYIINIICDLDIMENREIQRNGMIGLARSLSQNPEFHYDDYDLIVDTSSITPTAAAQKIKTFVDAQARS